MADIRELSDGRFGIFVDGICIHVEHSREAAIEWWKNTACLSHKERRAKDDEFLARGIRKLQE
jgi:hypothetical protein